jgi:hypothetical protein
MAHDPRSTVIETESSQPRRRGPHIGPIALTPTRVFLPLALIGSLAYVAYAATVRDSSQIPALAGGAALLGIVFVALAVAGIVETVRAGRDGRAGRSVVAAVFGGIAGIIALGCFAAAVLLTLVLRLGG